MRESRYFIVAFIVSLVLLTLFAFKATHGFVIYKTYAYTTSTILVDSGNGIKIGGDISAPITQKKHNRGWGIPTIDKSFAFGMVQTAKNNPAHARFHVRSAKPLENAHIHSVVVTDELGKNTPEHLQSIELSQNHPKSRTLFTSTNTDWHGFNVTGSGSIKIIGSATLEENNVNIPFDVTIPIDCIPMYTIMTQKKWKGFFGQSTSK